MFVRHDKVCNPLQQSYDGPFRVLDRADLNFTLDYNGRKDKVSADRLKSAHLETTSDISAVPVPGFTAAGTSKATPALPRMTCSGRHVYFPDHLMGLIESFTSSLEGE